MANRLISLGRIASKAWRDKRKRGWLKIDGHAVMKLPSFVAVHGREQKFKEGYRRHTIAVFTRAEHVSAIARAYTTVEPYGPALNNRSAVGTVCLDEYDSRVMSRSVLNVLKYVGELGYRPGISNLPMTCSAQAHYRLKGSQAKDGLPKEVCAKLAEWRLHGLRTALRIAGKAKCTVLFSKLNENRNNAFTDFRRACRKEGASMLEGKYNVLAFPRGVNAPHETPREKSKPLWQLD